MTEDMGSAMTEQESGTVTVASSYRKNTKRKIACIIFCLLLSMIAAVYSATLGSYPITAQEVYSTVWNVLIGNGDSLDPTIRHVVIDLRLPRIIAGFLCGLGLAISGVAMQSMLKNPLADPYTMGISTGASLGASLAIIFGIELFNAGIVANAFVFACVPALVILFLSKFKGATPLVMILVGVALNYLFSAIVQMVRLLADPDGLSDLFRWSVGNLDGVTYEHSLLIMIFCVIGMIYFQYVSNQLNIMGLGDETAKTMGVDVERKRLICILLVTLVAAGIVSFTGVIGFIGLVAPHIVRIIIGSDVKYLVPAAAAFGALLLLCSDIVARVVVAPTILPVGVVTSFIGGPLFLLLILHNSKEEWA